MEDDITREDRTVQQAGMMKSSAANASGESDTESIESLLSLHSNKFHESKKKYSLSEQEDQEQEGFEN